MLDVSTYIKQPCFFNKSIENLKSLQISMFHICFLIKYRKRDNNPLNTSVKTIPKKT